MFEGLPAPFNLPPPACYSNLSTTPNPSSLSSILLQTKWHHRADKRRRSSTLLVNSTASPQSLMNPHQAPGPASGPAAAPSTATTAANIARAVLGVPRVGGSGRLALGSVTRGENGANGSMSGPTPPSSSPTQRECGPHSSTHTSSWITNVHQSWVQG